MILAVCCSTEYKTYPMIRAAAVFMYRPSPSGFFGIGELGKFITGAGGFGDG
jgi:hypothetical protein